MLFRFRPAALFPPDIAKFIVRLRMMAIEPQHPLETLGGAAKIPCIVVTHGPVKCLLDIRF